MSSEAVPNVPLREFPRPVALRARLQRSTGVPEYLPARMLNEFVYCPRLFFYEWVEGVFAHNAHTVEGALRHEKIESPGDALPAAEAPADKIHSRSVTLASDPRGLIAVIDLVEGSQSTVTPVDYKKGSPRQGENGPEAWPADRVQVCAQALILRDNGYTCDEGIVYYSATKQRVRVVMNETVVTESLGALAEAREVARGGVIPPPLLDSPKCPRCSLVTICLPDETWSAGSFPADEEGGQQLDLFAAADVDHAPPATQAREVRRLVPARDDLRPLYVTGHGLTLGKSGEVLQVRDRGNLLQEVRLNEISQVNVFGSVQVTAAAIQGLCPAEKPVAYFSSGGWFYGLTQGLGLKNVFLRKQQFARSDDRAFCLLLSRQLVATKIRNQRTLVQRNHIEPPARAIEQLRRLAQRAMAVDDLESLLGIEGAAARTYFEQFRGMLKVGGDDQVAAFDFRHRNRRPPRDAVNALLSLAYAMLVRDLTIVCHGVGFDPFVGFYHQPRFGRPALALDLMEGFRPLVADSAVLSAINTRMATAADFVRAGDAVSLTVSGRKGLIRAYEQRMDQLVTHPLFGYRVSYRRVLEIQARLLARVVTGEIPRYPGFETR